MLTIFKYFIHTKLTFVFLFFYCSRDEIVEEIKSKAWRLYAAEWVT